MLIYQNSCDGPPELEACHDPEEVLDYKIYYSAPAWQASTKYLVDEVVYPTTRQGIYLICTQPGISAASEATWSTKKSYKNTDNTIIWKTVPKVLVLQEGEEVSDSTWASDAPYIFTHDGITGSLSVGDLVTGATSGATGYVERTVSSTEIYIQNIVGTFQDAEIVYETLGTNYVTLSNSGVDTITLASGSYTATTTTIWVGPINDALSDVTLTNTVETNTSPARVFERSFKVNIGDK